MAVQIHPAHPPVVQIPEPLQDKAHEVIIAKQSKADACFEEFSELSTRVRLHLEAHSINKTVDDILMADPEQVTYFLASFRKRDLNTNMQRFLKKINVNEDARDKYIKAMLVLYSTALANSQIGKSAEFLEKELPALIASSKQGQTLMDEASELLSQPVPEELEKLKTLQSDVSTMLPRLVLYLNLFAYVESDLEEKIRNVYTYTKNFAGTARFPVCKRLYPELVQQLRISENTRKEVQKLKGNLMQVAENLRYKIASFMQPKEVLKKPLEIVLEYHAIPLWDCCADMLERAFKLGFSPDVAIPTDFCKCVTTVARSQRPFKDFTFHKLFHNPMPPLPPQFICEVWDQFLGDNPDISDYSDLMRFIILKMPEELFEKLEAALKEANKKEAAMAVFYEFFETESVDPITMHTLREWIRKN